MYRKVIPIIYYILIIFISIATGMVLSGWIRQFILFFGSQLISTVTIIVSVLICLSLGSSITGRIADASRKTLVIFSVYCLITSFYIIFQSGAFKFLAYSFIKNAKLIGDGLFSNGLLRFFYSIIFLICPLFLIGGMIPLLMRHFIKYLDHSGKFTNAAEFSLSTGLAISIILLLILPLHVSGIKIIFILSWILFGLSFLISSLYFFFEKRNYGKRSQVEYYHNSAGKKMRFKKKSIVLEIRLKLIRALTRSYVFQGFIFSSMMILSYRILIRFSNAEAIFVVASIMIVSMTGLAIGSFLYKGLAEKTANKYVTLATLQILAGLTALISYLILNYFADWFNITVYEDFSVKKIIINNIILSALLLLIPSIIHGISFPIAGKLYPGRLNRIGRSIGRLGSLLHWSMLLGVLFTLYVFIPLTGIQLSYFFLSLIMLFSGIYIIFRDSRLVRIFRIGYGMLSIFLFIVILISFRMLNIEFKVNNSVRHIEGSALTLDAFKNKDHSLSVLADGKYYFGNNTIEKKEQIYSSLIPVIFSDHSIKNSLVIGFGTGITASFLEEFNVSSIIITETFPEVIKLSSDIFGEDNNDIITDSKVKISIANARSYLYTFSGKIDLITMGIEQISMFPDIFAAEFYDLCSDKLADSGVLCQIISTKIGLDQLLSICKTSSNFFKDISLWYVSSDKVLLLATNKYTKTEYCTISEKLDLLTGNSFFNSLNNKEPDYFLAHYICSKQQLSQLFQNSVIITDKKPFPEFGNSSENTGEVIDFIAKLDPDYNNIIDFTVNCGKPEDDIIREIISVKQSLIQQPALSSSPE